MNGFFKPLRRKIGAMTLLITCVIAGEWIRSFEFADFLWVTVCEQELILESINGKIRWHCQAHSAYFERQSPPYCGGGLLSERSKEPELFVEAAREVAIVRWGRRWITIGGKEYLATRPVDPEFLKVGGILFSIPHWSIVTPLTLLSAWLLLSKPRTRIESPITPASEKA